MFAFIIMLSCAQALAAPLSSVLGDKNLLAGRIMTLWSDSNGLPSNTILDIAQDSDGYLWLASYDGLVRFDGSAFSTYSDVDGRGFTAGSARELALGSDGRLWIGTNDSGVFSFKAGVFRHYTKDEGLGDLSARAVGFDSLGALWVGTAKGVYRLGSDDRFSKVEPASSSGSQGDFGIATFFMEVPGIGLVAASTGAGLWLARPEGISPLASVGGKAGGKSAALPKEFASRSFKTAKLDPSGALWLGTNDGTVFRVKDGAILDSREIDRKEGASVNAFLPLPDGSMLIGTDKGLVLYRDGAWSSFGSEDGLPNDVVSSLCSDCEGNIWVGTERGGLAKFSSSKFITLSAKAGLVDEAINATTEDQYGSLWVATDRGVSFHASARDPIASDKTRSKAVDALVASLKGVRVRQIRLAKDGSLWFATYSEKSLVRFDGRSTLAYGKKEGMPSDRVRMSREAADGSVLVGTTSGLAIIKDGALSVIGPEQGLPKHYVMDVAEGFAASGERSLLAATDGGGVAIIKAGKVEKLVDKSAGLAGNVVFRFLRDSKSRLWVCTGEGVSLWEAGGSVGSVTTKTGLPWASVFEMIEIEPGTLWLVSSKGIAAVAAADLEAMARGKARDLRVRVIDKRDGLAGQLSANAWSYRNERGTVYIPTLAGVSIYDAVRSTKNAVPPPVRIESVEIDGEYHAVLPDRLKLAPSAGRVTFRFAALSFVEPSKVACRYKLEGYDSSWTDAGLERSVSYTNLPPGDYSFLVSASNDDGVPSEREARVAFSKRPFFWQTTLFYLAIGAFLVAAGFLVALARLRKLEERKQELEHLVQERTKDLENEKATSEALLLNILPYRVAEELKRSGSSSPQLYPEATVLFADLVGFTEACGSLSPERTIEELNALFTAFDDIVLENGGERIKTIGDAYLAAAGLDGHNPRHCYEMCMIARAMMKELERRGAAGGMRWRARIGIACGPVVGGVVGVRKYIYDIFGDTVNIASRMQANSVPMGICVSKQIADRVRGSLPVIDRPPRAVKGKGELAMSFVAWRSEDPAAATTSRTAFDAGMRAFDEGDFASALHHLELVDMSVTEPETGHRAWLAIADCRQKAGDDEGAEQARTEARAFGFKGDND
jgi:Predicted periplasmic ligand-binding sensor domain